MPYPLLPDTFDPPLPPEAFIPAPGACNPRRGRGRPRKSSWREIVADVQKRWTAEWDRQLELIVADVMKLRGASRARVFQALQIDENSREL